MNKIYLTKNGIIEESIVDGPGLRMVIFMAGCPHQCDGCHNPTSWDITKGIEYQINDLFDIIQSEFHEPSILSGITISGGEPFMQYEALYELLNKIKFIKRDEKINIWVYTGYVFEELISMEKIYTDILKYIDVLVDGKYIKSKYIEKKLKWIGSSNQRIIDLNKTFKFGKIELLDIE